MEFLPKCSLLVWSFLSTFCPLDVSTCPSPEPLSVRRPEVDSGFPCPVPPASPPGDPVPSVARAPDLSILHLSHPLHRVHQQAPVALCLPNVSTLSLVPFSVLSCREPPSAAWTAVPRPERLSHCCCLFPTGICHQAARVISFSSKKMTSMNPIKPAPSGNHSKASRWLQSKAGCTSASPCPTWLLPQPSGPGVLGPYPPLPLLQPFSDAPRARLLRCVCTCSPCPPLPRRRAPASAAPPGGGLASHTVCIRFSLSQAPRLLLAFSRHPLMVLFFNYKNFKHVSR